MDVRDNLRDNRPFSYVYIVWRDVRSVFPSRKKLP
jgi:hypothetical protein